MAILGALLNAVDQGSDDNSRSFIVSVFAIMAIVSSYIGVSLGLFDFIADKFKFDSSVSGKTKTALVTFLPAAVAGLLLPNGLHYAVMAFGIVDAACHVLAMMDLLPVYG